MQICNRLKSKHPLHFPAQVVFRHPWRDASRETLAQQALITFQVQFLASQLPNPSSIQLTFSTPFLPTHQGSTYGHPVILFHCCLRVSQKSPSADSHFRVCPLLHGSSISTVTFFWPVKLHMPVKGSYPMHGVMPCV